MAETPRLFLITPPLVDAAAFRPLLETALHAADVACLLIRAAVRDDHTMKALVRDLAPVAQQRDTAVLIAQSARLAARLEVDGVHVAGGHDDLDDALRTLRPRKIVGIGGLTGRDSAMTAGEAGVDYLMFGSPDMPDSADAILDMVGWWADIFNVPCVGYARDPDCAADLAAAGADFVALCDGLWDDPGRIAETVRAVENACFAVPEDVR